MSTVKITCNCNFKKVEDVSSNVKKVFKMFESYFVKEDSPINKDSEIECIYIYKDLSVDNLRVFKKIAESNKTMLNLSNIEIIEEDEPKEYEPEEDEPKEDEPKEDEPKEDELKEDEPKEDEPEEDEPKEYEPKEDEEHKEESTLDDGNNSESDNGDIGDCLEINYESSDNEEEKVENDNIQNILKDLNILTERLNRLAEKELLD